MRSHCRGKTHPTSEKNAPTLWLWQDLYQKIQFNRIFVSTDLPNFSVFICDFFQTKKLHQAAIHNINNAINGHLGADILKNHLCKKVDAKQIQKVEKKTEKAVEIKL